MALFIVMPCCFALFALYACSASRKQPGSRACPLELLLHESEPGRREASWPGNRAGSLSCNNTIRFLDVYVRP